MPAYKSQVWVTVREFGPYTVKWCPRLAIFGCNCPHWLYQRVRIEDRKPCSHIKEVLETAPFSEQGGQR